MTTDDKRHGMKHGIYSPMTSRFKSDTRFAACGTLRSPVSYLFILSRHRNIKRERGIESHLENIAIGQALTHFGLARNTSSPSAI